jgi:hypothetical protein
VSVGLVLPGVSMTTGPGDPYPVESTQLVQFDAGRGLWSFLAVGSSRAVPAGPESVSLSAQEGRTAPFSARQ